jgi:DNA-binding NarL/FixJ family response regulator
VGLREQIDALADARRSRNRLPDDLTSREADVLRLLARGHSNREIGRSLFISQNTAANHVRSILMKTGSTNRTEAAAFAHRHGLAGE